MRSRERLSVAKLRNVFRQFMQENYLYIKPDSLISVAFPTTFTVSGGPNFADYYLDRNEVCEENTSVIQHCIRHWDYENVGDDYHLSFFEMAVTCSFNGYERFKMFKHHIEFITNQVGLPLDRLYVSVFSGGKVRGYQFPPDIEALDIWRELGIPDERILEIPKEVPSSISKELVTMRGPDAVVREAFVANVVEPVGGPRTEIFFDTGKEPKCKPVCLPGFCNCGKFIEFWTSVKYTVTVTPHPHERDRMGEIVLSFEPIEGHRIYAAGFGLERLVQISNSFNSIYEVDVVAPLIDELIKLLQNRGMISSEIESNRKAIITVAEHIRGITFLVAEGVTELKGSKNRSRKYEYRRYIKNLLAHMHRLRITNDRSIISSLVKSVIRIYSHEYPYLKGCTDKVVEEILKRGYQYGYGEIDRQNE